jgi:hypothetical protein
MAATAIVQGCSFAGIRPPGFHPDERRSILMKTLVTNKNVVTSKTIVNFKLQTFLFAFSILMHTVATSVAAEHPLLGWLLAMLGIVGWITILLTWVIALIKGIRYGVPKLWTKAWTYTRTHVRIQKAKKNNTPFVSVEQLKHLKSNIDRLGLAFYGMTPEMEQARRTHFQVVNEAAPALILPAQNAVLYAEFESLIRFLNHFGFPNLESVRLQHKDLAFARKWGSDLEARLQQAQRNYNYQLQTMQWLLGEANKKLEAISSTYQQAQNDAGYQRIAGALKLLTKMACKSHRPEEMIGYLTALLQDMESLRTQLKQTAA